MDENDDGKVDLKEMIGAIDTNDDNAWDFEEDVARELNDEEWTANMPDHHLEGYL